MRPVLIIGIGNPSRGDDALGPLLIERLAALNLPEVELLTDFQLQVDYALDLNGRHTVIFVDTSVSAPEPYSFDRLQAARDNSFSTHAVSPAAVLYTCQQLYDAPPQAWVLAIRGYAFELGEGSNPGATPELSPQAANNLELAFTALLAQHPSWRAA